MIENDTPKSPNLKNQKSGGVGGGVNLNSTKENCLPFG